MINIVRNIIEIHVSSIISNDNSSVEGQTWYENTILLGLYFYFIMVALRSCLADFSSSFSSWSSNWYLSQGHPTSL